MGIPKHKQRQAFRALGIVLNRVRQLVDSCEDYQTISEAIELAEKLVELLSLDEDAVESFRLNLKLFEEKYRWYIILSAFDEE